MSDLTMSKATREAFMADVHVGVFCVTRPGEAPLATPVWYRFVTVEGPAVLEDDYSNWDPSS